MSNDRTEFSPSEFTKLKMQVEDLRAEMYGGEGDDGIKRRLTTLEKDYDKRINYIYGMLAVLTAAGTAALWVADKVL